MPDGPQIVDVGDRKQLFLDEALIESSEGVRLTMHPLRPTGEVLIAPDQPWESGPGAGIGHCCCVLKEDGLFRAWYDYIERSEIPGEPPPVRAMSYAESGDGVHFTKPLLTLNPHGGADATNILLPSSRGGAVWIDPNAQPHQRYRTQCKGPLVTRDGRLHFFASPDGIHWELTHKVDVGACDTHSLVFWDELHGRYVLYTRLWERFDNAHLNHRKVRRLESDDLEHWDNETIVWEADEVDLGTHRTYTGQPPVDYYGGCVFRYPEAGDLYVMLAEAFWHWQSRPPAERWGYSGDPEKARIERLAPATMDVRLGYSRDGKRFRRCVDRGPFLGTGPQGRFDSRMVWAMPNPIRMGDELWFYYRGGNRDHDGFVDPASPGPLDGISRAVMRLDGFVSVDAPHAGAQVVTPPLTFSGNRLYLNLDAGGAGSLKVELLDQAGAAIEGFTRQRAATLRGNSVRMPACWGDNADVRRLAGRPVRVRFLMQDCKVYAFRFGQ